MRNRSESYVLFIRPNKSESFQIQWPVETLEHTSIQKALNKINILLAIWYLKINGWKLTSSSPHEYVLQGSVRNTPSRFQINKLSVGNSHDGHSSLRVSIKHHVSYSSVRPHVICILFSCISSWLVRKVPSYLSVNETMYQKNKNISPNRMKMCWLYITHYIKRGGVRPCV